MDGLVYSAALLTSGCFGTARLGCYNGLKAQMRPLFDGESSQFFLRLLDSEYAI